MRNSDLADQLTKNITNCNCFSLQFDDSVDVIDISQPCIFVLCCKVLNMRHVMGICMKIVNSIRGISLQIRIFRAQLEENESHYVELLYHADVC
ncbi:hypothetical protein TNCV_24391 [Trichonephila clavipes]|nr:hypothetical protein TNCV_24391 [Trichonephila clavipes]